jgi:hypothetical protein
MLPPCTRWALVWPEMYGFYRDFMGARPGIGGRAAIHHVAPQSFSKATTAVPNVQSTRCAWSSPRRRLRSWKD